MVRFVKNGNVMYFQKNKTKNQMSSFLGGTKASVKLEVMNSVIETSWRSKQLNFYCVIVVCVVLSRNSEIRLCFSFQNFFFCVLQP